MGLRYRGENIQEVYAQRDAAFALLKDLRDGYRCSDDHHPDSGFCQACDIDAILRQRCSPASGGTVNE
jgi:hypothetical protein